MRASLVLIASLLWVSVASADADPGATAKAAAHWILHHFKALSLRDENKLSKSRPGRALAECVRSLESEEIEAVTQETLLTQLGGADLKIADQFFETPAGRNFFLRDEATTYRGMGLEPPRLPTEPAPDEEQEAGKFLSTSASEKLRIAVTTETGKAPIIERINALLEACAAARLRQSH